MAGKMDGWKEINDRMDGWIDGLMDRRMDKRIDESKERIDI